MELIGWNTSNNSSAGAWKGITLTQYTNDRNVALVNELEPSYTGTTGDTNGSPNTAQQLGTLAPNQLNGDENLRLGFVVNGAISQDNPADQDVYSFQGTAGTQAWFQISNTSPSLDTVLQLVDSNGNVLAQSNDSFAEMTTSGLLASEQPGGKLTGANGLVVAPLTLGDFSGGDQANADPNGVNADLYSKNVKDAGMRLVLPGAAGQSFTYYIRVLSNGAKTDGQYSLQVRLQEQPEVAGSTVQFADIRDATTAIDLQGLPDSSPLTSTSTQAYDPTLAAQGFISNDTFDGAQDLGNLLSSDQNIISVSSQLVNAAQVQWYKFTLDYADVQSIEGATSADKTWSTIFDIDYAGGTARPDLTLSVFDALGNLIYISRNSNVVGDQPTPTASAQSNLSTGSSSPLDPFLGAVQLPVGASKTYYVAISSDAELPTDLSQTFLPSPGSPEALANPTLPTVPLALSLERIEPVDSVQRIVEDHIDPAIPTSDTTDPLTSCRSIPVALRLVGLCHDQPDDVVDPADYTRRSSTIPNLSQPNSVVSSISSNVSSFNLSSVPLFVAAENDNAIPTQLFSVNAATGAVLNKGNAIGRIPTVSGSLLAPTSTITMRSDGLLYGDQTIIGASANGGVAVIIDPSTAQDYPAGADNIPRATLPIQLPLPNPPTDPNNAVSTDPEFAVGGMTFVDTGAGQAHIVGDTDHYYAYYAVTDIFGISHLYVVNPSTGSAIGGKTSFFNPVELNSEGAFGPLDGSMYMNPPQFEHRADHAKRRRYRHGPGPRSHASAKSSISPMHPRSIAVRRSPLPTRIIRKRSNSCSRQAPIPAPIFRSLINTTDDADTVANKANTIINGLVNTPQTVECDYAGGGNFISVFGAFGATGGTSTVEVIDLPESGNSIYGVTATGQFITINTGFDEEFSSSSQGIVSSINTFGLNVHWAGLALAPQDLDINGDGFGGDLTDVLFAITTNGDIYAIDTDLNNGTGGLITQVASKIPGNPPVNLFPGGADHISTGLHNVQGLAFSPVDFNLWHPTTLGATDPGHGIDAAPDNSRNIPTEDTGTGTTAIAGGASYYFGLENFQTNSPATPPFHYLALPQLTFYDSVNGLINGSLPGSPNAQYGLQNSEEQLALTAYRDGIERIPAQVAANGIQNLLIGNDANAPGGTQGNLVTDSFSLAGYSPHGSADVVFRLRAGCRLERREKLGRRYRQGVGLDRRR